MIKTCSRYMFVVEEDYMHGYAHLMRMYTFVCTIALNAHSKWAYDTRWCRQGDLWSHYKNSGDLATFTDNSDQRLGYCINNVWASNLWNSRLALLPPLNSCSEWAAALESTGLYTHSGEYPLLRTLQIWLGRWYSLFVLASFHLPTSCNHCLSKQGIYFRLCRSGKWLAYSCACTIFYS
jgi:hypothetical protein